MIGMRRHERHVGERAGCSDLGPHRSHRERGPQGRREGPRLSLTWPVGAWPAPWRRERNQAMACGASQTGRHEAMAAARRPHRPTCCQDHPGRRAQGVAVTR